MSGPEQERLTVGTRWYLGAEALNGISAIAGVALFTRLVSPEVYGSYSVIMAAAGMGLSLTVEWLQFSTLRLLPGLRRPENEAAFVWSVLVLAGLASLFVTILGLCGAALVIPERLVQNFMVGWCYMASGIFFMSSTTIFQATMRAAYFALFRSGFAVLRIAFGYWLLTAYDSSEFSMVAGNVVAMLALVPSVFLLVRPRYRTSWKRGLVCTRKIAVFGGPMVGWFMASQVLNVSDRFLIKWFGSNYDVGQYTVTYALVVAVITACLQPLLAAAFPAIVRTMRSSGVHAAVEHLDQVLRIFFLLVPPLLMGLTIFGPDVVRFLAEESYQTPRSLISTLALGIVIWNLGLYLQKILELRLASVQLLYILIFAAAANVVSNLVLIPTMGIQGAAFSTVVGYSMYCLGILRFIKRPVNSIISRKVLGSLVLGTLGMVPVMLTLQQLFGDVYILVRLFIAGGGGLAIYGVILKWRGEFELFRTRPTEKH